MPLLYQIDTAKRRFFSSTRERRCPRRTTTPNAIASTSSCGGWTSSFRGESGSPTRVCVHDRKQFPVETAVDSCHPIDGASGECSSETGTCPNPRRASTPTADTPTILRAHEHPTLVGIACWFEASGRNRHATGLETLHSVLTRRSASAKNPVTSAGKAAQFSARSVSVSDRLNFNARDRRVALAANPLPDDSDVSSVYAAAVLAPCSYAVIQSTILQSIHRRSGSGPFWPMNPKWPP